MSAIACTFLLSACDLGKVTVNTTSKVLWRAQPSLENEADYDLAARAIPGTLKTIEGFWYVDKDNPRLTEILAKGYCQYGTGFAEDEWELASLARDLDKADYLSARATKFFVRCTNYALKLLGDKWQKNIFAELEVIEGMLKNFKGNRNALMWAAIGIASTINRNKDNIALVSQVPTVRAMLEKVVEIDDKKGHKNLALRALPHIALGMLHSAQAKALGGQPEKAKEHFTRAFEISEKRYLLARVLMARRYAVMTQDVELFRKTLVEVLQTSPSIWPDQRLANEIAHRRARRYLKHEKEWF